MHAVYDHEDWRTFLQQEVERRRSEGLDESVRDFAKKLEMDSAQFHRVLSGRAPLPFRYLARLVEILGMDRRSTAYLEELLRLGRARSQEEKSRCRERLTALRGVAASPVEGRQAQYYAHWRHSVIRSLVGSGGVRGDGAGLGALCIPPVTDQESRESLELLLELGLVVRGPDGTSRLSDSHLVSGPDVPVEVVRGFHRQAIDLARRALEEIPAQERDVSAVTAAVDASGLSALRDLAKDLRQKVQKLSHGTRSPDRVYQFNVQLFPVAFGSGPVSP